MNWPFSYIFQGFDYDNSLFLHFVFMKDFTSVDMGTRMFQILKAWLLAMQMPASHLKLCGQTLITWMALRFSPSIPLTFL